MLCVSLSGPSYSDIEKQLQQAKARGAQLVEIRVDLLAHIEIDRIAYIVRQSPLPFMVTLRSRNHGGRFEDRNGMAELLFQLAALQPAYLDIESDLPSEVIKKLYDAMGGRVIVSHHDCEKTPVELSSLWLQLINIPARYYKIATYAKTTTEALRLLDSARPYAPNAIAIPMGECGEAARLLAKPLDQPIVFSCLSPESSVAPGQIDIASIENPYRFSLLRPSTPWFALIGGSVVQSLSAHIHNAIYSDFGIDALYVKLKIAPEELDGLIPQLLTLGCCGCSVTMPHKEAIIDYLDEIDDKSNELGAVNTIVLRNGKSYGYNTDCTGALDAIESKRPVKGQRGIVIGSGGAARAIAMEAVWRGASITVVGRTEEKARAIAAACSCHSASLQEMASIAAAGYDFIVNATPAPMPIADEEILPATLVMETKTRPVWTPFLKAAERRNATIVFGYEMFINQGIGQAALWFPEIPSQRAGQIIAEVTLSILGEEIAARA